MTSLRPRDRRTAWLVSYKAASDVAGKAAVLGLLVLAARTLSPANFGVLSLATTLGWMAAVASDFGLQLYLGRAVTRAAVPSAVLWPLFALRLRTAAAALVVMAVLSWALAPDGTWIAFVLVASAPVITSVAEFLNYAYRGLGRSELESGLSLAQRLGALALVFVGLTVSPTLLTVGVALTVSALLTLATSLTIMHRALGIENQAALRTLPFQWTRDVAPIGAGLVLSALYFRVDVFLLEQWSGLEAVAQYSAVFRIVDAMRLIPGAVLTVLLPRLFGPRDPAFARRLAAGLTALALIVTAVTWPLASWIVSTAYGPAYVGAAAVLQVLLLSFPLLTLNYSLTHQLIGWDRPHAYAVCCVAALIANLALNTWLIPKAGAIGAAWATLGTEVIVTIACLVALQRSQTSR